MPITIRAARASDQRVVKHIVRAARINPTRLDWRRFLVAEDDGRVVGTGQVKPHGDGSRELASIAVIPERRRQGIAAQIIRALIEREPGVLYLTSRAELETFYTRFGFRKVGSDEMPPYFRRWYRFGELFHIPIPVIVMRRDPQ